MVEQIGWCLPPGRLMASSRVKPINSEEEDRLIASYDAWYKKPQNQLIPRYTQVCLCFCCNIAQSIHTVHVLKTNG